jgi:hypothetical protein
MQVVHGGEEHEAAIEKTRKAAKAAGKIAAIFCACATDSCLEQEHFFLIQRNAQQ